MGLRHPLGFPAHSARSAARRISSVPGWPQAHICSVTKPSCRGARTDRSARHVRAVRERILRGASHRRGSQRPGKADPGCSAYCRLATPSGQREEVLGPSRRGAGPATGGAGRTRRAARRGAHRARRRKAGRRLMDPCLTALASSSARPSAARRSGYRSRTTGTPPRVQFLTVTHHDRSPDRVAHQRQGLALKSDNRRAVVTDTSNVSPSGDSTVSTPSAIRPSWRRSSTGTPIARCQGQREHIFGERRPADCSCGRPGRGIATSGTSVLLRDSVRGTRYRRSSLFSPCPVSIRMLRAAMSARSSLCSASHARTASSASLSGRSQPLSPSSPTARPCGDGATADCPTSQPRPIFSHVRRTRQREWAIGVDTATTGPPGRPAQSDSSGPAH